MIRLATVCVFLCLVFGAAHVQGQVMIRNSFTLGKGFKHINTSVVAINLDRRTNPYTFFNGRGGRTLTIDLLALAGRKRTYTYQDLAERIYVPSPSVRYDPQAVPMYLMIEPPRIVIPEYTGNRVRQPR